MTDDFPERIERNRAEFVAEQLERLPKPADRVDPKRNWREEMKAHDALFNLDPGDTIRGYKITTPSFQTGDDTRGQNGDD